MIISMIKTVTVSPKVAKKNTMKNSYTLSESSLRALEEIKLETKSFDSLTDFWADIRS